MSSAYSLYGVDEATAPIAITTEDFATGAAEFFHTPADAPRVVDCDLLADTARFVADLITAWQARSLRHAQAPLSVRGE